MNLGLVVKLATYVSHDQISYGELLESLTVCQNEIDFLEPVGQLRVNITFSYKIEFGVICAVNLGYFDSLIWELFVFEILAGNKRCMWCKLLILRVGINLLICSAVWTYSVFVLGQVSLGLYRYFDLWVDIFVQVAQAGEVINVNESTTLYFYAVEDFVTA